VLSRSSRSGGRSRRRLLFTLPSIFGILVFAVFAAALGAVVTPSANAASSPHLAAPHPIVPRPHGAAPAVITGPLINHGGPVQTAPRVYVDYWGWTSDPSGEQSYLNSFLTALGGTPWLSVVGEYGGGWSGDLLAGAWSDPSSIPASPTDAQIQQEAAVAASHFGTGNSSNVQIIVATPTGHSTAGFGTSYCAYHGTVAADPNITYTDLPYMTDAGGNCGENSVNVGSSGVLDGVSIVEGHELAESITDPLLNAWYDASGYEIGDKCAWTNLANLTTYGGTFAVQPLWSNAANGCVLHPGGPSLNVVTAIGSAAYHEQRYSDGDWSTLNYQTTAPGTITSIGASTDSAGNLHVAMAVGSAIYHEIRFQNGSWSTLNFQTTAPGTINSIAAAYDRADNLLNVVIAVGDNIYHEQRYSNGSWSTLNYQTTAPGTINSIGASTDSAGNLQVPVAVGSAIYHEIRFQNGSWSALNFQTTAPGSITAISGAIG
jgi:hypothetical protein